MSFYTKTPACDADDDDVACLTCEDRGWTTTDGDIRIPCFDCRAGDLELYHDRRLRIAPHQPPKGSTHDQTEL